MMGIKLYDTGIVTNCRRRKKCPSLVLDLTAQYDSLEKTGLFRFTAPTHVMQAFGEALFELQDEGGVEGRAKRWSKSDLLFRKVPSV